jgi:hypothetical protein
VASKRGGAEGDGVGVQVANDFFAYLLGKCAEHDLSRDGGKVKFNCNSSMMEWDRLRRSTCTTLVLISHTILSVLEASNPRLLNPRSSGPRHNGRLRPQASFSDVHNRTEQPHAVLLAGDKLQQKVVIQIGKSQR